MDSLHFEGRDVKPHGEFALGDSLVEGETYFRVSYLDDHMLVPELIPLVFIGRDRQPDDSGRLYFQDADSHFAGARYESATDSDDVEIHVVDQDTPFVFEFEQALNILLMCSLKRRDSRGHSERQPTPPACG